ncbi:MAG: DNA-binding response regulator [Chloroflexota bacterium]|nr:DNA-binding response regulator [Chloroflexota bacterium]NOG62721.1 response regulator transcription factor [Chloroflexota bacterium]GIK63070.1 MAG: DNA-binding response regulator [Chloroflexota bacterium]
MDKPKVLLIESKQNNKKPSEVPESSFSIVLRRSYQVCLAHSAKMAVDVAVEHHPAVAILDSVSMRTTGIRVCQSLRRHAPHLPIIHIIPPPESGQKTRSGADVILPMPFTPRKLINRIERFLSTPIEQSNTIDVGPFKLDFQRNMLITHKGEYRLTPKMATLLEEFMHHPNEVLARGHLMSKVWETNYMGDTRTLDVHIRWIREAVEENPGKPLYIKTMRGVGYLLDLKAWQIEQAKKSSDGNR